MVNKKHGLILDEGLLKIFEDQGRDIASLELSDTRAKDWEDIAIGPGINSDYPCLYIADIGDNYTQRKFYTIHVVPEPEIVLTDSSQRYQTSVYSSIKYIYPDVQNHKY